MDSLIEQIATPEEFDAFITQNMRLATYTPLWKEEVSTTEYSDSGLFSTYTADYSAAMVASIIEKNADKPIRNMPTIGEITGSIARMGDRYQLGNDTLRKLLIMERRFRDRESTFTETQRKAAYFEIVKFLFDPYEKAAIAPHKRLDMLLFEGLSDGKFTVNLANNPDGIQYDPIDLGITRYKVDGAAVWNQANAATMKVVSTIKRVVNAQKAKGRLVNKLRMTQNTFDILAYSDEFNKNVKMAVNNLTVNPMGLISLDNVNLYLTSLGLPKIQIEEKYVMQLDGSMTNCFKDNRIVFQSGEKVAKMMVSDSVETYLPLPNRQYSSFEDNLISQYRTEQGRFIEYEMWGLPVFSGAQNFAILNIDQAEG